ncbi:MAG TPA: hypothetical protein VK279_11835 [Solirubrobacteraceae bacterium]|nr:hypothetical protein [Solirubrobacteraceae bacterium]
MDDAVARSGDQPSPSAPSISAVRISAGDASGKASPSSETTPAATGHAAEVPLSNGLWFSPPGRPAPKFPKKCEYAATSGFSGANMPGPCEE